MYLISRQQLIKRQKSPNQRIQWNKKGAFSQVTIYRVYGAFKLNRAAFSLHLIFQNHGRNILKGVATPQCSFAGFAIFLRIDGVLPIILIAR